MAAKAQEVFDPYSRQDGGRFGLQLPRRGTRRRRIETGRRAIGSAEGREDSGAISVPRCCPARFLRGTLRSSYRYEAVPRFESLHPLESVDGQATKLAQLGLKDGIVDRIPRDGSTPDPRTIGPAPKPGTKYRDTQGISWHEVRASNSRK